MGAPMALTPVAADPVDIEPTASVPPAVPAVPAAAASGTMDHVGREREVGTPMAFATPVARVPMVTAPAAPEEVTKCSANELRTSTLVATASAAESGSQCTAPLA